MTRINSEAVKGILPGRDADANKYSVGSLLCLCGSTGYAGAAVLALRSALRMGAGLVRCALPRSIYPIVSSSVPEAVFTHLPENARGTLSAEAVPELIKLCNRAQAVLLGCGMGCNRDTEEITLAVLAHCKVPIVLDADGINCVAKHINCIKECKVPLILTPHEGEMKRLTGIESRVIHQNREKTARELARSLGAVTILKGKGTLVTAENEDVYINPMGNAGMAVAGSGDVLAGIIASLLAQGTEPLSAAVAGVYLHGLAGDLGAEELTEYSLLPSDIIDYLPKAIKEVQGTKL